MEQKEPLGSKLSPRLASYQILDGQQTTVTQEDASAVNANGKKHKCTRLCRMCCCCCCCCSDENEDDESEDDIDLAWQRYQNKNVPLILVSSPRNTRTDTNVGDYDTFASTLDLKDVLLASDSSDSSKI